MLVDFEVIFSGLLVRDLFKLRCRDELCPLLRCDWLLEGASYRRLSLSLSRRLSRYRLCDLREWFRLRLRLGLRLRLLLYVSLLCRRLRLRLRYRLDLQLPKIMSEISYFSCLLRRKTRKNWLITVEHLQSELVKKFTELITKWIFLIKLQWKKYMKKIIIVARSFF